MSGREGEVLVLIVVLLVFTVAPIIVAARLAERRGRSVWFGILLSFLLGWIGVLVVLVAGRKKPTLGPAPSGEKRTRPCPACAAEMPCVAAACPACGEQSTPWTLHGGRWWSKDAAGAWQVMAEHLEAPGPSGFGREAPVGAADAHGRADGRTSFVGLDHVQVAAPPGREFDARRFYGGLLGLPELDKPPSLAARGGCWFGVGRQALHVGVASDFRPATKAHPALRLAARSELDEVAERLVAAGYEVEWADDAEVPGVHRCHVHDPFGNRVELLA